MDGLNYASLGTAVTTAISDIAPVGMTILAAMIGVSMIPKLIYKFL